MTEKHSRLRRVLFGKTAGVLLVILAVALAGCVIGVTLTCVCDAQAR